MSLIVETSSAASMDGSTRWSVAFSLQYPVLSKDKDNYFEWATKMKVFMEAQEIWDAVKPAAPDNAGAGADAAVDTRKDNIALAIIFQSIPEYMLSFLADKKTAREAWATLEMIHVGVGGVKRARARTLRSQLEGLRMEDAETVDCYGERLMTIVAKLRALGEEVDEPDVVKKFIGSVSARFSSPAAVIGELLDLTAMSAVEAIVRLKAYEEWIAVPVEGNTGNTPPAALVPRPRWRRRHVNRAEN